MAEKNQVVEAILRVLGLERRQKEAKASIPKKKLGGEPVGTEALVPQKYFTLDSPEFQVAVKSLFLKGADLMAGGIHLIGLSHVKEHFGDRWPDMVDRVRDIAGKAVESRLTPDDIYTCYGESLCFVVIFGKLSKEAADLKCALIAEEISKRIFGEGGRRDLIEVATSRIDQKGALGLSRIDSGKLVGQFSTGAKKGAVRHEVGTPGRPAQTTSPSTEAGSKQKEGKEGEEAKPISWEPTKKEVDPAVRQQEAEKLLKGLPPREKTLFSFGHLDFVFRPVWLVAKEVTSAHICVPARVTSEGTLRIGGAALLSSPGSPINAQYDLVTLKKVAMELADLAKQDKTAVLIAPVHYLTLVGSKPRRAFQEAYQVIPASLRAKIRFELIGTPSGVPHNQLASVFSVLRSLSDTPLVRVRLDFDDFGKYVGLGIYAIGFDITNYLTDEGALIEGFNTFAERADRFRFKIYAHGLRSHSLISAAVCAGFNYIDGDPVNSVVETPLENTPFSIASLYGSPKDADH